MTPPQLFSGSSNRTLATAVAREMKTTVGKVEITKFANDETRLVVKETGVGERAAVFQSFSKPVDSHIIEFGLLVDALYRLGAGSLVAVIPWLAYSKQDKVFRTGEPLSVKVIARILQTSPIRKILTFDLHNLAILGFFDIPVVNLSARQLFLDYFKPIVHDRTIVVAPDAGAIKASTAFATDLGVQVAYLDKKRDLATGKVSVMGLSSSVKGADIIIVDDMIVTGETLIETAKYLKDQGAKKIAVGATHHLYVPGTQDKLDKSVVDQVVVTDTIAPQIASDKLTVVTIAPILARELASIFH
jgi:ribose-phosphate pyrophosphokinase